MNHTLFRYLRLFWSDPNTRRESWLCSSSPKPDQILFRLTSIINSSSTTFGPGWPQTNKIMNRRTRLSILKQNFWNTQNAHTHTQDRRPWKYSKTHRHAYTYNIHMCFVKHTFIVTNLDLAWAGHTCLTLPPASHSCRLCRCHLRQTRRTQQHTLGTSADHL